MYRDFESASAIAGGHYQDVQWEETRYADLAEIVSIGEPYMRPKQLVSGVDTISGANLHLRHNMGYGKPVFVPYEIRLAPDQVIRGEIIMRREARQGSGSSMVECKAGEEKADRENISPLPEDSVYPCHLLPQP